jgi:MoxR-like ATPase
MSEADGASIEQREAQIFGETFLLKRPLLEAITQDRSPVLLIDEVDRADEAFEAYLLEVLAEWQVTIPEIGTIRARHRPHVVLTSNRTRELSDALRRRCLYLWIDYPSPDKELRIIARKVPGIDQRLAREIAKFMEHLRQVRLAKVPGVAETLDWAQALASLHADHIDDGLVAETLGCVLKDVDDMKRFRAEVAKSGLSPFLPTTS